MIMIILFYTLRIIKAPHPATPPRVAQNPRGNVALDCQGDSQGLSTSEAQSVELVFTALKRFVQIRIKISSTLSERSLIACVS